MRPYFFRQYIPRWDRQIEGIRNKQRGSAPAKKPKKSIMLRIKNFIKSLVPRRLTETDRWYLRMAAEKRARRRARNIRWWYRDSTWWQK